MSSSFRSTVWHSLVRFPAVVLICETYFEPNFKSTSLKFMEMQLRKLTDWHSRCVPGSAAATAASLHLVLDEKNSKRRIEHSSSLPIIPFAHSPLMFILYLPDGRPHPFIFILPIVPPPYSHTPNPHLSSSVAGFAMQAYVCNCVLGLNPMLRVV